MAKKEAGPPRVTLAQALERLREAEEREQKLLETVSRLRRAVHYKSGAEERCIQLSRRDTKLRIHMDEANRDIQDEIIEQEEQMEAIWDAALLTVSRSLEKK